MGETRQVDAHIRLYQVHPQGKHKKQLSARLYEFFVNSYSQENKCIQNGIDLGKDYKEKCKLYLKKNFTYFRRGITVPFTVSEECGQGMENVLQITDPLLRFLDWIAMRRVDEYILSNFKEIMKKRQQFIAVEKDAIGLCAAMSDLVIDRPVKKPKSHAKNSRSRARVRYVAPARWHLPELGQQTFQVRIGC